MNSKYFLFPLVLAVVNGAFAADPPPISVSSLGELLPMLSAPDKQGSQVEDALQKLAAHAARAGADAERIAFAKTLCNVATDTKLPIYVRRLVLQQLTVVAGAESIQPLSALLTDSDAKIREYARMDLERNPDPKSVDVLRETLKKGGDARWEIGLMNSLGMRHDAASVPLIAARVGKPETGSAALASLGKIATPEAVEVLEKALPASAQPLVEAAGVLAKKGLNPRAAAIAAKVYAAKVSIQMRAAALSTLAVADGNQAKSLISGALASDNPAMQAVAVSAAFKALGNQGACVALNPQLAQLKPAAKLAFGRLAGPLAEPAVLALLNDPDPEVQEGTAAALGRIGSAASVPALLNLAASAPRENTPAGAALSVIHGPGADQAIRKAAADTKGDVKSRVLAIAVLGWRADKTAAPELVRYAAETDAAVSRAACLALKNVGSEAELMPMLKLVSSGKVPNAATAVRSIAARSSARQQCVPSVLALGKGVSGKALIPMFDALSLIGGSEALQAVVGYTQSTDAEVVEGAVNAMCNWPELDGVAALLKVGVDPKLPEKLRITALRSTERIIRSAEDDSPQSRIDAAVGLLKAATREEEKGLALSVIASIPDRTGAQVLLPLLKDDNLKALACRASLNLADTLMSKDRGTAKKLANAVLTAKAEETIATRAQKILDKIKAHDAH